jgi:tRNA A-37 threonylcarbamoyl transferase component Bud32
MAEFPFQLLVKRISSKNKEESLLCTSLLRVIPGRRRVYDALWNDESVIAKVFSHKISARRHLRREWRGLNQLQRRGLSSPKPLFCGRTEDGQWTIVLEKIADSATVLDVLNETTEKLKELDLLVRICRELAKQHSKGVLQKDLHLGNFLLAGNRIYALDPSRMQFSRRQVPRKESISQLALLVRYLPTGDIESIRAICEEYFKARGWHFGKSDEALLQEQRTVHTRRGIRSGLKKCLRTSKRYLRIVAGRYVALFDRGFCRGAEPLDFIGQIDTLMDEGHILKNGNTCCVSRLTWNGKDVVVKRYNHKGFIHSLRHTIKRSRARRAWLHAHRLGMLQVSTPKPLVSVDQHKGLLIWKSYLVTEYVEGQRLYDFLRDDNVSQEQRSTMTQQAKNLLDKLGEHRLTHGDLKPSNILVTKTGPVLTDLDGMKVHKWNWTYKVMRARDNARFEDGLRSSPAVLSNTSPS